jgi:hypothetical protein
MRQDRLGDNAHAGSIAAVFDRIALFACTLACQSGGSKGAGGRSMGRWSCAAMAAAGVLGGCTHTRQLADIGFQPPEGSYRLIVMRPDVSVGVLTAGGAVEPRADWTIAARANILRAIEAQQAGRGGSVTIAATRDVSGTDPAAVADLDRLHAAVGAAIRIHKYGGPSLPTKTGRFDWTLGDDAVRFGRATGYDYALFLHAEDSFASSGRVAVQALGMLGCAVGFCVLARGGQQTAFASLVDLKTGRVVWFNALTSSVGDIRDPDGAAKMIASLLDRMKPGKRVATAAR